MTGRQPALTTSHEHSGPHIPDFEKDAQSIAAYDEARLRYERREASDAETKTRAAFTKKRDAIRAEIAVAASLLEERRMKAQKALSIYASRYPHRMERNKPVKPSFWESVLSFGSAGRLYRRAVQTAADATAAQSLRRRKEHDEEELEQQLKRALYLQEESIKKRMESAEGTDAFHARPGIAVLFKRVEEIKAERALYRARLERGDVSPIEQRDREFSERKIGHLEAPFAGVTIVRVVRYGDLSYYLLRDLERHLLYLPYDPRLEPLIENVFDVYRLADAFEVKLTRGADGRPMPPLQHYLTNYKDEEVARSEFRKARTALRTPRTDLPPMTLIDANEQMLLDLLANFARTLTPPTTVAGAAAAAAAAVAPGTAATATGAAAASEPEVIEHLPAPTPEN
jgi:hypothetical protein